MAAPNKRIMKEYADVSNPDSKVMQGTTVKLAIDDDMSNWIAEMPGPTGSVYAGGKFTLKIELPKNYPFKPPKIQFDTKIYHPNVTNDGTGLVCLPMLRGDEWKPPNKIIDVLDKIRILLSSPNPDDAVETSIADQYKNDHAAFTKTAKEWVQLYATGKKQK